MLETEDKEWVWDEFWPVLSVVVLEERMVVLEESCPLVPEQIWSLFLCQVYECVWLGIWPPEMPPHT